MFACPVVISIGSIFQGWRICRGPDLSCFIVLLSRDGNYCGLKENSTKYWFWRGLTAFESWFLICRASPLTAGSQRLKIKKSELKVQTFLRDPAGTSRRVHLCLHALLCKKTITRIMDGFPEGGINFSSQLFFATQKKSLRNAEGRAHFVIPLGLPAYCGINFSPSGSK